MRQRWPSRLWLVRHGQSAGNVARDAAAASGRDMIDLQTAPLLEDEQARVTAEPDAIAGTR